jgi:sialic acid synthase SpsE
MPRTLKLDRLCVATQRAHIVYKRADASLHPEEIVPLLDKARLARDVEENAPLNWRYFAPLESNNS